MQIRTWPTILHDEIVHPATSGRGNITELGEGRYPRPTRKRKQPDGEVARRLKDTHGSMRKKEENTDRQLTASGDRGWKQMEKGKQQSTIVIAMS
jgi:hypothetical protein